MKFWKKPRSSRLSTTNSKSASDFKEFVEEDEPLSNEEIKTLNNEVYQFTASNYPSRNLLTPTPNGSFTVESLLQVKTGTSEKKPSKKGIQSSIGNGSSSSLFSLKGNCNFGDNYSNTKNTRCKNSSGNDGTNFSSGNFLGARGSLNISRSISNNNCLSKSSVSTKTKSTIGRSLSVSDSALAAVPTPVKSPVSSSTSVSVTSCHQLRRLPTEPNPNCDNPNPLSLSTSSDDLEKHDDEAKGKSSQAMSSFSSTSSPSLFTTSPAFLPFSYSHSPSSSLLTEAPPLHDHLVVKPQSKKPMLTDVTGLLSASHATMSNPLTIDTSAPASNNQHLSQRPEPQRQKSQQKFVPLNSPAKSLNYQQQQISPQMLYQQNIQLQQQAAHEKSLSPMSSMIFERSVQDVHCPASTNKIPLHHSNDDFIPSVLDASAEILTSRNIDPETVEVLSLRRPSSVRSFSFSDHAHQDSFPRNESIVSTQSFLNNQRFQFLNNDPTAIVTSPVPNSPSNQSSVAVSPTSIRSPSNSALSSLTTSPSRNLHRPSISSMSHGSKKKDCCVLSFCSFADLIDCEHAATTTNGSVVASSTNGVAAMPNSQVTGLISPASDKSLKLGSTPTSPNTVTTEGIPFSAPNAYSLSSGTTTDTYGNLPSNASISLSDDLDTGEFDSSTGLDISSLGETIRRNTNVISTNS